MLPFINAVHGLHPLSIPKGLHHSAQGCAARATLGLQLQTIPTLKGVYQISHDDYVADGGWENAARHRYNPFGVGPCCVLVPG